MISDNILEVIDKTGRKIRLTRRQFQHVICHKGMEDYVGEPPENRTIHGAVAPRASKARAPLANRGFQAAVAHRAFDLEEIKDTLINPLKIVSHEAGELCDYYNYCKNREQKAKYLQVVVKYLNGDGFVITAYFVRHM